MSVNEILDRDEDRPAYIRFETRAVPDKAATLKAGHHVSVDEDWALVTPPYSRDCLRRPVKKWFDQVKEKVKQGRIPERHLRIWEETYKRWKEGQEEPVNGTSIKEWTILSPAQVKNLIAVGIRTVEDMAACNDEGLRRIGMGGVDLKNKARAWLQAAKDHGPLTLEMANLQKENEQLKGSLESLQEQVRLLTMQLENKSNPVIETQTETYNDISAADIIDRTPAEMYEEKFGKPPHHMMKEETILKKLQEA